MAAFKTLDDLDVGGKRVLVRVDFNVPMDGDRVSDTTRLERAVPTVRELVDRKARVILLSHFGRPKGARVPEMSLRPVADAFAGVLGRPVSFVEESRGEIAERAVAGLADGDVLLLENTRFEAGEEKNAADYADDLAKLGDFYVNDAFSAAHRAHASTEGIAQRLPSAAGRSMQRELDYLALALAAPKRPVMAVVGGAKVSTKLDVLENLIEKADKLVVGGGMANTFLLAKGMDIGKSLAEPDLAATARSIADKAAAQGCALLLPKDVVVAKEFAPNPDTRVCAPDDVAADEMILDVGPESVDQYAAELEGCATLLWNGPLGAFETPPFHTATVELAKFGAKLSVAGALTSIAGGGDTVAALNVAQAAEDFTYVSTAGGAFLEFIEGKTLPGVAALETSAASSA
ncbi:phosphoglycerate kinase [Parvularcula bermudensis HTCC2503]|uniref:Phosphoglycerate kinase n=1 Tax=Parvularcula bermudensis (strain ATCC BAA-594 / HTCC2503 / KCTC 12087) TaxID=314260 RepID=E0TCN4_PARBH|nr:phosphoglycerate kinase [Parvularcula bermudensis]ADM08623.1 phosphoglycerate kinase [Parvularcula bermudensis HTCC2503]